VVVLGLAVLTSRKLQVTFIRFMIETVCEALLLNIDYTILYRYSVDCLPLLQDDNCLNLASSLSSPSIDRNRLTSHLQTSNVVSKNKYKLTTDGLQI